MLERYPKIKPVLGFMVNFALWHLDSDMQFLSGPHLMTLEVLKVRYLRGYIYIYIYIDIDIDSTVA